MGGLFYKFRITDYLEWDGVEVLRRWEWSYDVWLGGSYGGIFFERIIIYIGS